MTEEKAEAGRPKLYTRMRLWEFPDQYVIEPTDGSNGSSLAVSRVDGSMSLIEKLPESSSVRVPKIRTIFGVVGVLKLVAGSYLMVITERQSVGSYLGHPIYKVSSFKVFPCDHSLRNSPAEQKKMETEFSALLNIAERTPGLYFSYEANLTLSSQRLNDLGGESKSLPLWRQAEPRFLWNNYMLENLIDNKLDPYLLPIVQGSFHHFQAAIGKDIVDVTLIARRCTRRNGTRMWRRGADPDGYVANFVETEQIMHLNGFTASFVQVRGSIPLLWDQIVDLTYKPKFEIVRLEEAPRVAERHFLDLRKKYGAVLAVDLVNTHGGEGRLSEKFANAMQHIVSDDLRYWHFDFHHICGHVHFERLSILYEQIVDFLDRNGYLLLNENGEKMKEQLGVVRTNCIDCLDRTNVTQSMIGRNMLECQLRRLGIFAAEETISSHPNLDECFKILWADHGDDVSIQYSGTPALKGDFVRCGQRTMQGMVKDGINSLLRYYYNNFCDGTKQDAIDLLQGHYIVSVSKDMTAPSQKKGLEAVASFPLALSFVLTGFFFATLSLRQVRYDLRHLFFSFMWAGLSVAIAAFVRANGRIFCNRPRLHKPRS
ncbi:putative phosphatidylinositol-3,4-bisphosphate 4-phosphatase [Rosa chinensis]|uniref:Putative phosphatidylinositol-3,4-bisphosphate 4-phosphatase n=1 Tax=Rosa chinensis TaxID=74649 RepID=A0A2P6RLB0_ROSCH|nr:phosphoinositide phosphatase SAC6 isoform X2 [Rosa chinensis]PRQ47224.1 putative phosphatidylinositol-3,4-bisphosphate 4-phosphatase [Rosa chinensis]